MNILPARNNLNKRHVMVENTCPVCRGHAELVCMFSLIVIFLRIVGMPLPLVIIEGRVRVLLIVF